MIGIRPGVLVLVRRRGGRFSHLFVRVVGPGWLIGHRPKSGLCHRARLDRVVRISGWRP